jgi:histidine triad (HIT) family protein
MEHITQPNCIFCKIRDGLLPSTIILQNDLLFVIKDIAPKAPIHYLIIPKKHFHDINALQPTDADIMSALLLAAKELSLQLAGDQSYRLVVNNGKGAGQIVFHLHIHFLSGGHMPGMMSKEL